MTIMDPRGAFPPIHPSMPDDGHCWRWNLPHETERPFCDKPQEHLGPCHIPDTVDETQAAE